MSASVIDRSAVNRALAKAIAYKQCGKDEQAHVWAAHLVNLLACASIVDNNWVNRSRQYAREEYGDKADLPW